MHLVLTGELGTGKSTLQRQLVESDGFWSPITATTRIVDDQDAFMAAVSLDEFQSNSAAGILVLPTYFGGSWYAWQRSDVERMRSSSQPPAVLNVRPYTALVLATFLPEAVPVWLWIEQEERMRRRHARNAARDTDASGIRAAQDQADLAYGDFFKTRVKSDANALKTLLRISKGSL